MINPLQFFAYQGDHTYALPDGYEELAGMMIPEGEDPALYIKSRIQRIDNQRRQEVNQDIEKVKILANQYGSFTMGIDADNHLIVPTHASFSPNCPIVVNEKTSLTMEDIPTVIQQVPGISVAGRCDVSKQELIKSPGRSDIVSVEEFPFTEDVIEEYQDLSYLILKSQQGKSKKLANFIPCIISKREIINALGEVETLWYEVGIKMRGGQKILTIRGQDIAKFSAVLKKEIPEALTSSDIVNADKKVTNYLLEKAPFTPIKRVIETSGWYRIAGKWSFIDDSRNVSGFEIKCGRRLGIYVPPEYLRETVGKVFSISQKCEIIAPLLTFALSGILFRIFDEVGYPLHFALFINGTSGTFKTSLANILFRMYGRQSIFLSFESTKTAIEQAIMRGRDEVVLIDDYHPGSSSAEKKELDEKLERVSRLIGDGVGRNRSNGKLQEIKGGRPEATVVITGEQSGGSLSTRLRYVQVNIEPGDIEADSLTWLQSNPDMFPSLMRVFIHYVETNWDGLAQIIKNGFQIERAWLDQQLTDRRPIDQAASLLLVAEIFADFLINCGYTMPYDVEIIKEALRNGIVATVKESNDEAQRNNPAYSYLESVRQLLALEQITFAESKYIYEQHMADYIGYKVDDGIMFNADGLYQRVLAYHKARNQILPTQEKCHQQLAEAKVIVQYPNGKDKTTNVKRMLFKTSEGSLRIPLLHMKAEAIFEK